MSTEEYWACKKKDKSCRRFIFRNNLGNERVFNVNIAQFELSGQVYLCEILINLTKKGLNIKDNLFYMPQFGITIEAGDKCRVPNNVMNQREIYFQVNEIEGTSENYNALYQNQESTEKTEIENEATDNAFCRFQQDNDIENGLLCQNFTQLEIDEKNFQQNEQPTPIEAQESFFDNNQKPQFKEKILKKQIAIKNQVCKKQKQQEKTIYEALFKTKAWRRLHEDYHISLKNAAKMIKLSKKTLDDYFLVLRVGQAHDYDFQANLGKKIGHLRAYIRSQPVKISGRLQKEIKSFALVGEPDFSNFEEIQYWEKSQFIDEVDIQEKPNKQKAEEHWKLSQEDHEGLSEPISL